MWEYKTLIYASFGGKIHGMDDAMNELGAEGWELVGTISGSSAAMANASGVLFFKRRLS